jgi:hypothetical protein
MPNGISVKYYVIKSKILIYTIGNNKTNKKAKERVKQIGFSIFKTKDIFLVKLLVAFKAQYKKPCFYLCDIKILDLFCIF